MALGDAAQLSSLHPAEHETVHQLRHMQCPIQSPRALASMLWHRAGWQGTWVCESDNHKAYEMYKRWVAVGQQQQRAFQGHGAAACCASAQVHTHTRHCVLGKCTTGPRRPCLRRRWKAGVKEEPAAAAAASH